MTSPTGSNKRVRGLTLIEVLVTVSILSLGTVLIAQSNITSLGAYSLYLNRLRVQSWAEEKIWKAQEAILKDAAPDGSGEETIGGKTYRWNLSTTSDAYDKVEFYTIDLKVFWKEGNRNEELFLRSTFRKFKRI